MAGGKKVRELFAKYCEMLDTALKAVFHRQVDLDMYKHMAYFMGFADETLKPATIYGGKRFRSSLALMLGDWYGAEGKSLDVALAIELFHNFTLIHDDIVDGDTLRRGRPTVWKLFGTDHAINSGDGQLMLAMESVMTSSLYTPEEKVAIYTFLSNQFRRVIEGQYLDFTLTALPLGDAQVNEEKYFEMIGRKTSDLIAASTKVSGIVTGQNEEECEHLFEYGYNLGLAYQLCDDTISIWGSEEQTGKRPYGDILERKKTIPILHLYKQADEETKQQLLEIYNGEDDLTNEEAQKVIAFLDAYEVYPYMRTLCTEYADKAKFAAKALSLPDECIESLTSVVDILLPDIKKVD